MQNMFNIYGVASNLLVICLGLILFIIAKLLEIRRYKQIIAELEYELEQYESYANEEKRTELKNYDLSKDREFKGH